VDAAAEAANTLLAAVEWCQAHQKQFLYAYMMCHRLASKYGQVQMAAMALPVHLCVRVKLMVCKLQCQTNFVSAVLVQSSSDNNNVMHKQLLPAVQMLSQQHIGPLTLSGVTLSGCNSGSCLSPHACCLLLTSASRRRS